MMDRRRVLAIVLDIFTFCSLAAGRERGEEGCLCRMLTKVNFHLSSENRLYILFNILLIASKQVGTYQVSRVAGAAHF